MNENKILEDMCYYINRCNDSQLTKEELINAHVGLKDAIHATLSASIKQANIHDTFEYYYSYGHVTSVDARSPKTGTSYELGYYHLNGELFFKTYIRNSYNLKNLQDDFLCNFFAVMEKYKFIYHDSHPTECRNKYPDMFKHFKGNVFRMMRSYFMQISEGYVNDYNFELGDLEAVWDMSKYMEEIYAELCVATKWFYKFNYQLWKIEDLKKFKNK